MPLTLEPNALVGSRYRLLHFLGKGGMGEVWAAEQIVTRKRVALKFLLGAAEAGNESTKRRFMREARAACAVSHPNVVQIHDVIELEDGVPAMVMELLVGESLEAKLNRDGKLSAQETIAVMGRVVSAVGTAHTQGVVHRDLKPDNIFLVETPDGTDVKVLDFGIAKVGNTEDGSQTGALTATGAMLGTPYYMSPEQAFGEKKIDHRCDIWSLGIVMFRCLTGTLPTKADNLGQILKIIMTQSIPKLALVAPSAPAELTAMVDKMLSYAAKDRPADLREVKEVLDRLGSVGIADFGEADVLRTTDDGASSGDTSSGPFDASTSGDRASAGLSSGGLSSGGVTSTSSVEARKRFPPALFALGAAVLLALVTVAVVLGKHDRATSQRSTPIASSMETGSSAPPATTGSTGTESARTLQSPVASAPAASSAASSEEGPGAASADAPAASPPVAAPHATLAAAVASGHLTNKSSASAAAPPTSAPTSMGGIVTENPFHK